MDSQACVFKVHVNITLRMMNNKCIFASKLTSKTSNMVNVCGILFISVIFLDQFLEAVKIYEFGTTLEEKSRVVIKNNAPTPEAFTLCLDFYSRLEKNRQLLEAKNKYDLDIEIDNESAVIYIRVAGVWFLAI